MLCVAGRRIGLGELERDWAMTSVKTVLVPLDGSVHATAAIPVARGFGELLQAPIALLHVSDDALTPPALVERMKTSGEELPGLILEHRPGADRKSTRLNSSHMSISYAVFCLKKKKKKHKNKQNISNK